jgi:hypothetical protein
MVKEPRQHEGFRKRDPKDAHMKEANRDEHGVFHRAGCPKDLWAITRDYITGITIHRCIDCGVVRLTPIGDQP